MPKCNQKRIRELVHEISGLLGEESMETALAVVACLTAL
jgi:hypothetical protein